MENPISLEDFVKMAAFVKVSNKDFTRMYKTFDIDEDKWTEISMHWMGQIGSDPELAVRFQQLMVAEIGRQQSAAAPG